MRMRPFNIIVMFYHLLWLRKLVLIKQVMLCSAEELLVVLSVTMLLLRIIINSIEHTLLIRYLDLQFLEMALQVLPKDHNSKYLTDPKMYQNGNQVYNKSHINTNKTTICSIKNSLFHTKNILFSKKTI